MTHVDGHPGVIVVAGDDLYDAFAQLEASWDLQPRTPSVSALWAGLSSGTLDKQSRILVFTDLYPAAPAEDSDPRAIARAIATMVGAGAIVILLPQSPETGDPIASQVRGRLELDGASVDTFHVIEGNPRGNELIAALREALGSLVTIDDAVAPPSAPADGRIPTMPTLAPSSGEDQPARRIPGIPEQASAELLARPKTPGQVTITVTSSKGGSGKSTASILLASAIARASREAGKPLSVCLIDLDTRDGQVASMIGQFMPTALNIRVQPIWDEERIRRNLVHADALGIDTLLAPIRPRTAQTVGPDFYRAVVRSLQRMFDVVVMDTSVQYLDPLIAEVALVEADEVLFVTNLAATAVQGMARALREITAPVDESGLGIPREKIGIIVNQSVANVGMEREQVLAAGLGVPVVGVIPLATKDVLAATNLNRMQELLEHPVVGPAYLQLAQACLPNHALVPWPMPETAPTHDGESVGPASEDPGKRRGFLRRP